jgi:ubiquinone biosynthesis protein COQ9
MSDTAFDNALITAAFEIAADRGWQRVSVADAARAADLSLAEARARFPTRGTILLRFGQLADRAVLEDAPATGPVRDRLFDLLIRRYDALQPHRAGIKALLRTLPFNPGRAMLLHCATHRSMRWMLQAAGVSATGPRGEVRMRALTAIWYWGLRSWERDESEDLSATMAVLDSALQRADRCAAWLQGRRSDPAPEAAGDAEPSDSSSDVAGTAERTQADDSPATEPPV